MPGNCRGSNIGTLTPVRFSVVYGGAKSRVVTISLSPQGKALKSEKLLSPPIPVGGGGGRNDITTLALYGCGYK